MATDRCLSSVVLCAVNRYGGGSMWSEVSLWGASVEAWCIHTCARYRSHSMRVRTRCHFLLLLQRSVLLCILCLLYSQWRRKDRACQVKWPGWKIHRPGSSPAYCFALVIVWTRDKNVTISDQFICFILMVKRRWRPVFWGRQLKQETHQEMR